MKTSAEIRSSFLEFFHSKGHEIVASSSLVPGNDPSLLFTNAGMVQFKDCFLGAEKRSYARAASSQRCLRAGGKHNDLDSVGYTARHHTFFEMLGNFSFGDYFKREAISYAWELLTKVYALPKDKLWVTIYHTDDEAFDIWTKEIGVPAERLIRIGDKPGGGSDNFWQMADTGPCGPCTEIFFDHGPEVPGGPPGSANEDGDRYIEIWNLVFMQFDRAKDGSLSPLPAPCVDTGMGLERLTAVLQHVHSNYEIDLFQHLIRAAGKLTKTHDLQNKSLRVIADHIRACSFLVIDGVLPSNEGRGYVLRRIIRRALRHGHILGVHEPFFHRMVEPLIEAMSSAYPALQDKRETLEQVLLSEEQRFGETLEQGMRVFEEIAARSPQEIPGADAFRLYDTYGFPVDLTADIARERGLSVDMPGFEQAMEEQRQRARAASQFGNQAAHLGADFVKDLKPTNFLGYKGLNANDLKVIAIVRGGRGVEELADGDDAILILERTPFYAESGGQVGDTGSLSADYGRFLVRDTVKLTGAFHGHVGSWHGKNLRVGATLDGNVDVERRQSVVLNHSATHLLHAALRRMLGGHVQQKGSLVAPDRLRFDFSYSAPIGSNELKRIEDLVNIQIRRNVEVEIQEMGYQQAIDAGAMALFGEKYGEQVRVLKMGDFSTELCGGTHAVRTGDIGVLKIISESGVAAGIRRIEAVTGAAAMAHIAEEEYQLSEVSKLLSVSSAEAAEKLRQLLDKHKRVERELETYRARAALSAIHDLIPGAVDVGAGVKVISARLDDLDSKTLRDSVDQLKQQLGDCVVLLASVSGGKVAIIGGVHGTALNKIKAGDLVGYVATQIGGKGGGRADMAQGGGDDSPQLVRALSSVNNWVATQLGQIENLPKGV